jgi:hypothetical protein
MKQALILGCSHAFGSEIFTRSAETRYHSYPSILAQKLGYTVNNLSISGGSNDAMFRIYEEQQSTLDSSDIVIACWSGYNRTEIWNNAKKDWQAIAPGKTDISSKEYLNYQQQWIIYHTDDRIGRLNKIKNIIALNSLAMQQNIQVINIDSFWPVTDIVWPSSMHWPLDNNFWDWCNTNNYPRTKWGHFFEPAHQAFAEVIVESIKTKVDKV